MIDPRLIEAEALQPLDEPTPALWRAVVFSFLTGFVVVSIVGVGIVQGWWK
jgi:hypothetical protein